MDEQPKFDYSQYAQTQIQDAEQEYLKTKNALHVWYAYGQCRRHNFPTPAWVQDYLDRVAMNFLRLLYQPGESIPEQRPGPITDALEMPNPGKALFKEVLMDSNQSPNLWIGPHSGGG